jgi:hypothetical protein
MAVRKGRGGKTPYSVDTGKFHASAALRIVNSDDFFKQR